MSVLTLIVVLFMTLSFSSKALEKYTYSVNIFISTSLTPINVYKKVLLNTLKDANICINYALQSTLSKTILYFTQSSMVLSAETSLHP
jgi:hypothetical protein